MLTIIFEPHGTTLDNEAGLSSGLYDVELSDLGKSQAGELGQRYQEKHLDAIFCSGLRRSYDTAEIAFGNSGIPIIKDTRLNECDYGDFTRKLSEQVESEKGNRIGQPFPNGQSYQETANQMKEFLDELKEKYDGKTVMIIGHRATQYGLEHWINHEPLKKAVTDPWAWQPGWTYIF